MNLKVYGIIYLITCLVNGKIYVGQTVKTLTERWKKHLEYAKYGGDGHFQKAIRLYGAKNFTMEPICFAGNQEELDKLEDHYIKKMNCLNPNIGYNHAWRKPRGAEGRLKCGEKQKGELNHTYRHDLNDEDLIEMYKEGISLSQIAVIVMSSRGLVTKRLREQGIEVKSKPGEIINLPEKEICSAYTEGVSIGILAKKNGVSCYKIRKILDKFNTPTHEVIYKKRINEKLKKEILSLREQKISQRQITKILGICRETVTHYVNQDKEPIKKIKLTPKVGKDSSVFRLDIDNLVLANEYLSGTSTIELAKRYNSGKTTIKNRLKSLGIKLRTPREAQLIRVTQNP